MAPKVLISDKLSPAAVQIFNDRGIDVDFQPDLGKDKAKLLDVIGQYDGLAIRSGYPCRIQEGDHRDEHALRELHHHGGARDFHDDGGGPSNPRGERIDSRR